MGKVAGSKCGKLCGYKVKPQKECIADLSPKELDRLIAKDTKNSKKKTLKKK